MGGCSFQLCWFFATIENIFAGLLYWIPFNLHVNTVVLENPHLLQLITIQNINLKHIQCEISWGSVLCSQHHLGY